jgi:hypothetical protein
MQGEDGYSPYLKYAQDAAGRSTSSRPSGDHPRQFDNSLYHGVLAATSCACQRRHGRSP